jgi:hypothetical protein
MAPSGGCHSGVGGDEHGSTGFVPAGIKHRANRVHADPAAALTIDPGAGAAVARDAAATAVTYAGDALPLPLHSPVTPLPLPVPKTPVLPLLVA